MKIAIFEKEHFEGAFPVIRLFDMPGNEITVITSPETYQRFADLFKENSKRYNWIILSAGNKLRFFYSFYKHLKRLNPDILYINTISDNHLLYARALSWLSLKRVVLTVHDINCLFESPASWNFRKAIIHSGKKQVIKQVDEFNVVADTMTAYLRTKTGMKNTYAIPGAIFEGRQVQQSISWPLRIVVPGSLDKKRRDYEQVFELLALAEKEKLELHIMLLGGHHDVYGRNIIDRAQRLLFPCCRVDCYDTDVVDQDEFDRQMDASHFVWIPSVVQTTICGDIPETYGLTKSSGNIFDVIKHAKPFIVPAGLTIPFYLSRSCFKYNSVNDIVDLLKGFAIKPGTYTDWQKSALENSLNYTIEKVRERNGGLFYPTGNVS